MKIESINGFHIGDKVRLKDGDGRPHIIKSFEIDGFKEFFCVAHFEDGTSSVLGNLSLLEPQGLDEAAVKFANQDCVTFISRKEGFKAGAEWMASQGETIEGMYKTE